MQSADNVNESLTWVNDLYSLVQADKIDEGLDLLFHKVDGLLLAGQFDLCDELLQAIDVARLDIYLIVGVLSITLAAAEHLPHMLSFIGRARARLRILVPGRIDKLLSGLC